MAQPRIGRPQWHKRKGLRTLPLIAVVSLGGCRSWVLPGAGRGCQPPRSQDIQAAGPVSPAAEYVPASERLCGSWTLPGLCAGAAAFLATNRHSLRCRATSQGTSTSKDVGAKGAAEEKPEVTLATKEEEPDGLIGTTLGVLLAIFFSLFDIFKEAPVEATGKDAPGIAAVGPGGVLGALDGCEVVSVADGTVQDAKKLGDDSTATLVIFTTHFGDFNSWEVLQQLRCAQKEGRTRGVRTAVVGIGTAESGRKLAEFLELPFGFQLFADPTGACHKALGFSTGALPEYSRQLNPYFRVFLMLLGVGSPGTLRTVLSGYFGNTDLPKEKTSWVDEALKQGAAQGRFPTTVPQRLPWEAKKPGEKEWVDLAEKGSGVWDGRGFGETGLRPFELATVRLQNMVSGIIANWGDLKPPDDELLVQQGGAVVLRGGEAVYFYKDKGILTYVPVEDALAVARGDA